MTRIYQKFVSMCLARNINSGLFSLFLIQITSNLFSFFISNNLNDFLFFLLCFLTFTSTGLDRQENIFSYSVSKFPASHPDLDFFWRVMSIMNFFPLSTRMLYMILSERIEFCGLLIVIFLAFTKQWFISDVHQKQIFLTL